MPTAIPSVIYLQAGIDQGHRVDLASETNTQLANAQSTGTFINGIGKSDQQGSKMDVPLRGFKDPLKRSLIMAHRGPGESLYIAVDPTTAAAQVTANAVIVLRERIVNVQTGAVRNVTHTQADTTTDTTNGGVAVNQGFVPGQRIPMAAWRPLGPHEYGVLRGYVTAVPSST